MRAVPEQESRKISGTLLRVSQPCTELIGRRARNPDTMADLRRTLSYTLTYRPETSFRSVQRKPLQLG
jgi:hypothetical protein